MHMCKEELLASYLITCPVSNKGTKSMINAHEIFYT